MPAHIVYRMEPQDYLIVAYYKFVDLPDYEARREPLLKVCVEHDVKGTVLLASEGLNSTMAGSAEGIQAVLDYLESDPAIGELLVKRAWASTSPFYRMKVRLKQEIVRLGLPSVSPNDQVGEYVDPANWNALISDPNVILIDTRNAYEHEIGSFQGALDPGTTHFQEFPAFAQEHLADKKDKKIAMFCTGGIRCEKSTSYLLQEGFEKVYHLKGGILNYLEKVDPDESLWEGDCFVFDNRVAVDHQLQRGNYECCRSCRHTLGEAERNSDEYVEGVCCPHCAASQTEEQRNRAIERQRQVELSEDSGRPHIGATETELEEWRREKLRQRSR
jgi:UPF0176 protein